MSYQNTPLARSRRRLLMSLATAGGALVTARSLPVAWVKPVVDSVSLPAHAATSAVYLPSAGAASIVLSREDSGSRFTLLNELVPTADAVITVALVYVCVVPSTDGTTADVAVYEGVSPCSSTSATSINRHTGTGLAVPSSGNLLTFQEDVCSSSAGNGDLLNRLGLLKNALADGAITVDIASVDNGAKGAVHVGLVEYVFDLSPGLCSPPTCCR